MSKDDATLPQVAPPAATGNAGPQFEGCGASRGHEHAAFRGHPDGEPLRRSSDHDAKDGLGLAAGHEDAALCCGAARKLRRPVITSVQLTDLGIALMEESNIAVDRPIKMADAERYRDGLMIALLAYAPLRHKNFAAIEIGRDLIKEDGNRFIVIPPEETKTKTYIEFEIPDELRERLSIYLNHVRPRMLRQLGCRALWVSPKGGSLSEARGCR